MSTVNSVTVVDLILPFFFFCPRYNPWWVLACFNSAIGNIFTGIVCKDHYSKKPMTNGLSEYEVQVLLSKRHNMKFQWWQLQKTKPIWWMMIVSECEIGLTKENWGPVFKSWFSHKLQQIFKHHCRSQSQCFCASQYSRNILDSLTIVH